MAMQRLMNLLRNSQTSCTDSECIQDGGPMSRDPSGSGYNMMMMIMIGWLIVATALYILRPSTMRRSLDEKPSPARGNGGDNPPAPPIH